MKRFISCLAALAMTVSLFGCGGTNKAEIPPAKSVDILSEADCEAAINNSSDLVISGSEKDLGDGTYETTYVSDPIGQCDSITIRVTQPSKDENGNDKVKQKYDELYESRSKRKAVDGLGEATFIAFPTIHIYEKGYLIDITAGSGDSDEQVNMLVSLGQTAVGKLNDYLVNGPQATSTPTEEED